MPIVATCAKTKNRESVAPRRRILASLVRVSGERAGRRATVFGRHNHERARVPPTGSESLLWVAAREYGTWPLVSRA
jgi:hypothetical protein